MENIFCCEKSIKAGAVLNCTGPLPARTEATPVQQPAEMAAHTPEDTKSV